MLQGSAGGQRAPHLGGEWQWCLDRGRARRKAGFPPVRQCRLCKANGWKCFVPLLLKCNTMQLGKPQPWRGARGLQPRGLGDAARGDSLLLC